MTKVEIEGWWCIRTASIRTAAKDGLVLTKEPDLQEITLSQDHDEEYGLIRFPLAVIRFLEEP